MSVGGKVCDIVRDSDRVWINTDDGHSTKCAIYVDKDDNSVQVTKGDIVWWQGREAYWTTADRKTHIEVVLTRRGYSHSGKPRHLRVAGEGE